MSSNRRRNFGKIASKKSKRKTNQEVAEKVRQLLDLIKEKK